MPKKIILHLITGLGVGGTETSLLQLLPEMQTHYNNHVCCIMGKGLTGKKLEEKGIPVHYLLLRNPFDIGCIFRFRRIITSIRPDILITYLIHADLFGRMFGKLFGIRKIVCSERGSLLQWEFLRFFDRLTSSFVDKYTVQTFVAKQELIRKLHISEDSVQIIPNPIDTSEYDFKMNTEIKKGSLGIDKNDINIICVSNLRQGKGHEYLLEAFEEVYKKHTGINLLLAGDGEKMDSLKKQASGYVSKKNIRFLGKRDDIKELLKISDIFVLPTLAEGMSNAIMEAMASKVPIVTTNIPANKTLLQDPQCGILVEPGNGKELARALSDIIQNPKSTQKLLENAYSVVLRKHDVRSIKKLWVTLISKL